MNLNHQLKILIAGLLFSLQAQSSVLTEEFSTLTNIDTGTTTAVVNVESGVVHPTLEINYRVYSSDATYSTQAVDIGDGSDGIFDLSTYSSIGTVDGSNNITLDASGGRIFKFKRFQLNAGYTLTSINGPLVIYSQSTAVIDGDILCYGNDGSISSGATPGNGGVGRCGGKNGGNGGAPGASGTSGDSSSASVTGGGGGVFNGDTNGSGGGGGGSYAYGSSASAGANAVTNTGGSAGLTSANLDFTILTGSSGGGGGSGSNIGTASGGGGGGAGGGTVIIHATGDVTISGFIKAYGGKGGNSTYGGGGGGGAGGSVSILTAGKLTLSASGQINADLGLRGTTTNTPIGDGGNAATGRTWDEAGSYNYVGSESPASNLDNPGDNPGLLVGSQAVRYVTTSVLVTSKSFDTASNSPTYNSISTSPVTAEATLEVAGSNDNFASDNTGWLSSSSISSLNSKRYVKFRMTLTNSNDASPTQITSVSVNYTPGTSTTNTILKENFEFKSGCGMISSNNSDPREGFVSFLSLLLLPLVLALRLRLKTIHPD